MGGRKVVKGECVLPWVKLYIPVILDDTACFLFPVFQQPLETCVNGTGRALDVDHTSLDWDEDKWKHT